MKRYLALNKELEIKLVGIQPLHHNVISRSSLDINHYFSADHVYVEMDNKASTFLECRRGQMKVFCVKSEVYEKESGEILSLSR